MATGLHITTQKSNNKGWYLLSLIVVVILAASAWYGYMYYTRGVIPPVPLPIATADPRVVEEDIAQEELEAHTVAPSEPRYLSASSLGIERSRIMKVGITSNQELDTPRNIHDTGWYQESALPGEGSAAVLLDGHNGGPTKGGVFEHLDALQLGDIITIERGDGRKVSYEVAKNDSISLEDMNKTGMKQMSESISNDGQGLNIISCTGTWIPKLNTYDRRQVVRATAINVEL